MATRKRPAAPEPCVVCGAPSTRVVGIRPACDRCAGPLHQAALAKRDAMLLALRQLARDRTVEENEGVAA